MRKNALFFLVVLSAALNISFVAVWLAHAAASRHEFAKSRVAPQQETSVWCPLHRQLDVDQQQWQEIEPRLKEFQASVSELSQRVDQLRSDVIDLVAGEEPKLETIHARQEEILATKREIQRLVISHLLAEKEVLAPDQLKQLFEMLRNRTGCASPPMSAHSSEGGLGRVLGDGAGR